MAHFSRRIFPASDRRLARRPDWNCTLFPTLVLGRQAENADSHPTWLVKLRSFDKSGGAIISRNSVSFLQLCHAHQSLEHYCLQSLEHDCLQVNSTLLGGVIEP